MARSLRKHKFLLGEKEGPNKFDFSEKIEFKDHKIKISVKHCKNKKVLDIGCVQHNPKNYKSKYWLHRALKSVSSSIVGIDLYKPGVDYLIKKGFNVIHADACDFDLGEKFDTIVCGDIIEHLEDFNGFIECCKNHMNENSRLIISTPNPWYWRNTIKAAIGKEVDNNPEHTCWLCPRTLRQLLNRHDIQIEEIVFGSRYARDLLLPLPRGWKHTSFHAICKNK